MVKIKIVVCIKQVPGTTDIRINPETNTLIREGVETVINPFDTYAIEEGVRIKERLLADPEAKEEVEVIAMTMGPHQSESILREAISLGADRAVLLSDRAFAGADTWATALTLRAAIKKIDDCRLVILGKQTLDGDTGQVGPELAQMMHIPFIGYASSIININSSRITVKRLMEDRYETFEVRLPASISVGKDINVPRVPSLRGKLKAKNEQIPVWDKNELGLQDPEIGLPGSYTQVIKIFTPRHQYEVKMLTGTPDEQAGEIYSKLVEMNILQ